MDPQAEHMLSMTKLWQKVPQSSEHALTHMQEKRLVMVSSTPGHRSSGLAGMSPSRISAQVVQLGVLVLVPGESPTT